MNQQTLKIAPYDYLNSSHLIGGKVYSINYERGFFRVSCEGAAAPEFNRRTSGEAKRAIELSLKKQM
jgi:hypothetical protein